jgi:large subunit ribosomal protein L30
MAKSTGKTATGSTATEKTATGRTATGKTAKGKTVKVKLVRSWIGTPKDQRATLAGLGLKRMNSERELQDSPTVRGLIFKVRHLLEVDPPAPSV